MATAPPGSPAEIAEAAGLPEGWTVTTAVEQVPSPVDIGQTVPRIHFARVTTTVRDSAGGYVCASGSLDDACAQALALVEQRMQPYVRDLWPHP